MDEIGGLSVEAKNRAREILCNVWDEAGAEALQWNLGRFQPISKPEILFAFLCEYEEKSYEGGVPLESRTVARECVRNMRSNGETSRSPHRRGYYSQLAREYSDAVYFMSREAPSLLQEKWDDYSWENVCYRVKDKCPNRVDRIRCLGNAVVPQQFYIFFKLIRDIEERGENL